jgi:hypothetical protein
MKYRSTEYGVSLSNLILKTLNNTEFIDIK